MWRKRLWRSVSDSFGFGTRLLLLSFISGPSDRLSAQRSRDRLTNLKSVVYSYMKIAKFQENSGQQQCDKAKQKRRYAAADGISYSLCPTLLGAWWSSQR
jgi:hypothetical protein